MGHTSAKDRSGVREPQAFRDPDEVIRVTDDVSAR